MNITRSIPIKIINKRFSDHNDFKIYLRLRKFKLRFKKKYFSKIEFFQGICFLPSSYLELR